MTKKIDISRFEEMAVPLGILGLKITQDGEELVSKLWGDDRRYDIHSACKSITSFAVGKAVEEGLLSLEEKLTDAFPDEIAGLSDNLKRATVRDLITMRLGQREPNIKGVQRPYYDRDDWVRMCLEVPFVDAPGEKFLYNNAGPYLAAVLVARRAGESLVDYLMPRLFAPLDIPRPTWECDRHGNAIGADGLLLTLGELHKIALVYLGGGEYNGKRLISREWVEESAKDRGDGYGYLFWVAKRSYGMVGKYGQRAEIYPDKNAVISYVSFCRAGGLTELMRDHLEPQL